MQRLAVMNREDLEGQQILNGFFAIGVPPPILSGTGPILGSGIEPSCGGGLLDRNGDHLGAGRVGAYHMILAAYDELERVRCPRHQAPVWAQSGI